MFLPQDNLVDRLGGVNGDTIGNWLVMQNLEA